MNPKINKFLEKHAIAIRDIKYIIREDGKTAIYLDSGRIVTTYHTIKEFKESLPTEEFFYPNKGVLVAAAYIVNVSDGAYTMTDGRSFKYRVHNSQLHDMRLLTLGRHMEQTRSETETPHYSVLDKMPLSVCIIEHIADKPGSVGTFACCYCNEALLRLEQLEQEEILGKPLLEVFPGIDANAIIAFADVALNGSARLVELYSHRLDLLLKMYCYQPYPDHCACVFTDSRPLTQEEQLNPRCKVSIL